MANYVSPTWVNDNVPALNAQNLQALTDAVEKNQTLEGTGAPTTSTAGDIGQLYNDTSTTPYTTYVCVGRSGSTYTWRLDSSIMTVDFGTLTATGTTATSTVSNTNITNAHEVISYVVGTPSAQVSDITVTTSNGSATASGVISGSTTLKVILGLPAITAS